MAALWATNEQQRDVSYRVMAQQLSDLDALKADVQLEQAADILFALLSFEMYSVFTTTRAWTPQHGNSGPSTPSTPSCSVDPLKHGRSGLLDFPGAVTRVHVRSRSAGLLAGQT
jgi:hypothetical protein